MAPIDTLSSLICFINFDYNKIHIGNVYAANYKY